ncbi:fibronectin type III domain-containing protein [Micromonospora zamorensis]|uniref:fibronectin type III domain-containing protein n=1 Tax=Micromonospora zamorensis TaxID=709883 RepID=UPI003CF4F411
MAIMSALVALVIITLPAPAAAQAPVRVMTIGDSITAGADGDYTWRYRLWQHLSASGTSVDFVGDNSAPHQGTYAASGWDGDHQASWGMPAWIQKDHTRDAVARHLPDLIVIHIGTNDLAYGTEAPAAAEEVRAIVTAARASRPSVKFLLMKIIPRKGTDNEVTEDFNTRIAALVGTESTAGSPIAVADAYLGVDPTQDLYDGTHPNRIGEYKIAKAVADGLWRSYGIGKEYGALPNIPTGPDVPAGVSASSGDAAATISWSPVRTATSYNVYARDRTVGQTTFNLVQFGVTATEWRQTILWNGHEYEYYVTAVRWFDESSPSSAVRVVPSAPRPNPPAGVTTTSNRNTAKITWSAVSGVESYSVYRRDVTDNGRFQQVQFNVTATTWTQTLLTSGHVYAYYVTSVSRGMESIPSATSQVEVEPDPDAPKNVRVIAGDGRATISWSSVENASSYRVYSRDTDAGGGFQMVQWNLTTTSWTQQLLHNGHRYEYYVTALNGGSEGAKSVTVAAVPYATPPAAPTNLRASAAGTSITLTWNAVTGVNNYSVYRRDVTAGQQSYTEVQFGLTATTWTQTLLTPGRVYEYYVIGVKSVRGHASDSVRIMAGGPRPGTPSSLTATPGSHSVKLAWSSVSGAENYTVYGRDVTTSEAWHPVQWNVQGTTWTQTILQDGHKYSYFVVAVRGYLEGGSSPTASAVPYTPPPPAPTGVNATVGNGSFTVSWNPVAGAESYTVYLAVPSQGSTSFKAVQWDIKGTSWTQQYVSPWQRHIYYVTAVAAGAASAPSDRAAVSWAPWKPYPCNYLTPAEPTVVGNDANGSLSLQWNVSDASAAWGFRLSPALIALGNGGAAPAVMTAHYMVNGAIDPSFKRDTGEAADYWFHSRYRGPAGNGLYAGNEIFLDVTVEFDFYVQGTRGHAKVRAKDCYQLMSP